MAAITSLGIGSGVDINSMVTQLVALERRPLQQMQASASRLQTQVSSFGKLQSQFSALQDAANKLNDATLWSRSVAASGNDAVVGAVGGGSAAAGNYSVTVQALASSQTLATGSVFTTANELVGSGTLTIDVGAWDSGNTGFLPKQPHTPVTLNLSSADTLGSLRDKINAAGAGVTASIVSDATGVRLALRSSESGAGNAVRLRAADGDGNDTDAAGLSRFAFDPPGGAGGLLQKQAAGDARATVNGIDVVSASNELVGSVEGLTLRLRQVSATPVDVSVSNDREAVKGALTAFAAAYSDIARTINEQTKFDPTSKVGGALQGDSAVTGLQQRLRGVLNASSGASTVFPRLSDVGLQLQRDGTLKVDEAKIGTALGNLVELKKAFTNNDPGAPAEHGFARRYAALATQVLSVDGSLTTRTDSLRKLIDRNGDDQQRLNDRVERFQQRLVQQYSAMDANLSKLNALSGYMTQQLAQLNKQSN